MSSKDAVVAYVTIPKEEEVASEAAVADDDAEAPSDAEAEESK